MRREHDGLIIDDNRKDFVFRIPVQTGVLVIGTKADTEEQAKRMIDLYLEECGWSEVRRAA